MYSDRWLKKNGLRRAEMGYIKNGSRRRRPTATTGITDDANHPILQCNNSTLFLSLSFSSQHTHSVQRSFLPFNTDHNQINHHSLLSIRPLTMTTELLQIEPAELRFLFELKKQSSCLVQLRNKADQYIAFKVKTTSPKKYCVRPNIGIIKPKETCDFTVTMQAQRMAPLDMQCKDKFLIQSTVVPFGTAEDDLTSDMFAKDSGKYIEEKKLRVVLISPPSSPVLLPVNGDTKHDPSNEVNVQKDRVPPSGVENIPPPPRVSEEIIGSEPALDTREDKADENIVPRQAENVSDTKTEKDEVQFDLANESEELKSRLSIMDSKLREAEVTIMKLNEERRMNTQEKDSLKKELEVLKRKMSTKGVQAGFPLLFVCMVALISVAIGYYLHP
ncbi:hypothetical protein RJT34_32191 [Clitoria ternatea]|uniref:MSP domain-containing protein n=1 Tax=Clitoria ternatea TaxID=43366 RepID=A0AAN9EVY7_CLITE